MLKSQEIHSGKLDKFMGRGYKAEQVDAFLERIAADYAQLERENDELQRKLMVLAENIEKYREDEDSLRSAIIGAQKLGDKVIRDAKEKAAAILEDADAKASHKLENVQSALQREHQAYVRARREIAAFKVKMQQMYKQHLDMIDRLPGDDQLSGQGADLPENLTQAQEAALSETPSSQTPAPTEIPQVPEPSSQTEQAPASTDDTEMISLEELESELLQTDSQSQADISLSGEQGKRSGRRAPRSDLQFGTNFNLRGKKR